MSDAAWAAWRGAAKPGSGAGGLEPFLPAVPLVGFAKAEFEGDRLPDPQLSPGPGHVADPPGVGKGRKTVSVEEDVLAEPLRKYVRVELHPPDDGPGDDPDLDLLFHHLFQGRPEVFERVHL